MTNRLDRCVGVGVTNSDLFVDEFSSGVITNSEDDSLELQDELSIIK